ncbi:rhomboid family intramembrane serine protease [Crateriforma conspicua]|uniref:Rhomboid protease GlpG n=1 Tax=Crateriforma conspicua TaxID=2527996 RepID=A0A5C5YBC8_9PLAN|nr:rhomboid family intramembrane serine protease [Crateriforma conspicua]QDV61598.1 Rhomboid protease GlpG [Crateriforma conspicua]TWT72153.1 Rhomboid protease GlpG [Crateriforma conspicua]
MGLYDRDYGRGGMRSPWDRVENPRSMTITLIIINVAVFFADMIFSDRETGFSLASWLAVSSESLTQPWKIWQVLTYGFVHDDQNIRHILFNMFGLFIFGRIVEQRIGAAEFLRFYLCAIIVGGFAAAISGLAFGDAPTIGASGAVVAVTILFACYFPNTEILLMFVLPVKAWVLAVLYVGFDLFGALGLAGDSNTAFQVHLSGAAFGLLYFFRGWNLGFLADGLGGMNQMSDKIRSRSRRMKLKLHDPDRKLAQEAREADRILDKIHRNGEDSLTAAERRTLERYSARQRKKRQQAE